ncbi:MAG: tetratricopeptide repeat protein [bacterium]
MLKFEREKVKIEEQKFDQAVKEDLDKELGYLEKKDFTQVNHGAIEHDLMMKEFEARIDDSSEQKTMIIDSKKKTKLSSKALDGFKEAEILMSEGLYDKASQKLFKLLEDEPGNPEIKALMEKVIKLSNNMDSIQSTNQHDTIDMTTDEMIHDLEKYLDSKASEHDYNISSAENVETKGIVELFNSRIKDLLLPDDYKTLFDLGIAYMELELWAEATGSFKKVIDYLSTHNDDSDKLMESRIYYAYSLARGGRYNEIDDSIKFLNDLLKEASYERYKLDILYYLAICYEMKGDISNARNSYQGIYSMDPSYRDIDVRLAVIGK